MDRVWTECQVLVCFISWLGLATLAVYGCCIFSINSPVIVIMLQVLMEPSYQQSRAPLPACPAAPPGAPAETRPPSYSGSKRRRESRYSGREMKTNHNRRNVYCRGENNNSSHYAKKSSISFIQPGSFLA